MRPSSFIVGIAAATIFVSSALAEEHPCVQPQDPFVVALCSDPELRATADQQREEMMALWNRLPPQEQDKFRNDQLAWRDFTAPRCRVDQLSLQPLSAETKNCLKQAEARRIEFLRHYGQTETPTALHPNTPRRSHRQHLSPPPTITTPPLTRGGFATVLHGRSGSTPCRAITRPVRFTGRASARCRIRDAVRFVADSSLEESGFETRSPIVVSQLARRTERASP